MTTTLSIQPSSSDAPPSSPSSKAVVAASECFRLYCKAVVRLETVMGSGPSGDVILAGAGVAICDHRDNLIFEKRENLKALEACPLLLSMRAAEIQALMIGCKEALSLNLKSVTFFCEDYSYLVRPQVNRNSRVLGSEKIAALVDQLNLLQRKFEYCSPCLEVLLVLYERHVEVKLQNGMVPQCPHKDCKSEVNIDMCGILLAPKVVDALTERIKDSSIPFRQKVYCPFPRCSTLMSNQEVLKLSKTCLSEGDRIRKCTKCYRYFCIDFKVPWHNGMTCYNFQRSLTRFHSEDQLLKSLATMEKWRQCSNCNHMIELDSGCCHITCRCGYQFCYTCGAECEKYNRRCSCPLWDEHYIIWA